MTEMQANAPAAVKKYVLPDIVNYPSWLFPEPDIKADAVFSQYCRFPARALRQLVSEGSPPHGREALGGAKVAKQELKKPTVFDGAMSPLWMQRNNRDHNWGKTGGGMREALMKVDWADMIPRSGCSSRPTRSTRP